jgi:hypothetical protein
MADYVSVDPNTLLPGEPWTSAKALAAFENPEAIAEGSPGAPRIMSAALGTYLGRVALATSSTAEAITGLDPLTVISIMGNFANGTADTAALEVSASSDGGACTHTPPESQPHPQ